MNEGIEKYRNKYDYLKRIDKISQWRLSPSYNIQRYDGEQEGFFSLHNESSGSYPYRMLAWTIYLNDAKGEEHMYVRTTASTRSLKTSEIADYVANRFE